MSIFHIWVWKENKNLKKELKELQEKQNKRIEVLEKEINSLEIKNKHLEQTLAQEFKKSANLYVEPYCYAPMPEFLYQYDRYNKEWVEYRMRTSPWRYERESEES